MSSVKCADDTASFRSCGNSSSSNNNNKLISERTGEPLEVQFSFQRISVSVQRFNQGSIQSSFTRLFQLRTTPTRSHSNLLLFFVFLPPGSLLPEVFKKL